MILFILAGALGGFIVWALVTGLHKLIDSRTQSILQRNSLIADYLRALNETVSQINEYEISLGNLDLWEPRSEWLHSQIARYNDLVKSSRPLDQLIYGREQWLQAYQRRDEYSFVPIAMDKLSEGQFVAIPGPFNPPGGWLQ